MALDDADKKFIADLIAASLKASGEDTKKLVEGTVGAAIKGLDLDKKLEVVKGDIDKKIETKPDDKVMKKDDKALVIDEHPEFRKLQAKVREQEEAAARAESERRANLLRTSVQDALVAAGADPKRVPFAIDRLVASGAVKLDDKGAPVWPQKRSWGDDPVPVATAAKEWLATDEGKFFVPPANTQGTGDRAGAGAGQRTTEAPKTKDGNVDWAALAQRTNLAPLVAALND